MIRYIQVQKSDSLCSTFCTTGTGVRQQTLHYLSAANSRSNNHALIFFNTKNREGAFEEATLLKGSFSSLGMTTTFEEWEHFLGHEKSLRKRLQDCMAAIKETCSLLVICVMAHGKRGLIIDSFGLEGEINSLFELVSELMPEKIPVVRAEHFDVFYLSYHF